MANTSATAHGPAQTETGNPRSGSTGVTRLNINLSEETAASLRELAEARGISFTEAVRRAIAIYKFVEDEVAAGNQVQSVDTGRGTVRELVLL
jgi:predicted transcriptional regulator